MRLDALLPQLIRRRRRQGLDIKLPWLVVVRCWARQGSGQTRIQTHGINRNFDLSNLQRIRPFTSDLTPSRMCHEMATQFEQTGASIGAKTLQQHQLPDTVKSATSAKTTRARAKPAAWNFCSLAFSLERLQQKRIRRALYITLRITLHSRDHDCHEYINNILTIVSAVPAE